MNRRVVATVVLGAGLLNRAAIAEQVLEVIRASDPQGTYLIEARDGSGSLMPPHDEDWAITIVSVRAAASLQITGRMIFPPLSSEDSNEE